jgi:hypothetical protein
MHMLGGLEAALFMKQLTNRFEGTKAEAISSFIIPLSLFPLPFLMMCASPSIQIGSAVTLFILGFLRLMLSFFVLLSVIYLMTKTLRDKASLLKFICANNWVCLPVSILYIPPVFMILGGAYSWSTLYPALLCIMGYSYICTGYIAARTLKLPWELAGFITVCALAVNKSTYSLMLWFGGII